MEGGRARPPSLMLLSLLLAQEVKIIVTIQHASPPLAERIFYFESVLF
jgi:hypothetical protein